MKKLSLLTAVLLCLALLTIPAAAAETDCDGIYCFSETDFASPEQSLSGICITGLPDSAVGTAFLGNRILREGDILTADQLAQMTFLPTQTEEDTRAALSYLPICEDRVESAATTVLSIRGKKDQAPVAEDSAAETYKNLPAEGTLKVTDPEGKTMQYTVTRQPKRGEVIVREDGSFLYTPKHNKVGVDSFVYTATDPAGNVSREATVTVQILKPADGRRYSDTAGTSCRYTAEWMRNAGIFAGETVGSESCFRPTATVSRGELIAMLTKTLEISAEDAETAGVPENAPQWLQPYLAAALRAGLVTPEDLTGLEDTATCADAAVMIQNGLNIAVSTDFIAARTALGKEEITTDARAAASLLALESVGVTLDGDAALTRETAANVLYAVRNKMN